MSSPTEASSLPATTRSAVPDVKVVDMKRVELRDRFDELYPILNPQAGMAARQAKLDKLKASS